MRSEMMPSMRFILASVLLFTVAPALSVAQTSVGKVRHTSRLAVGKSASLPRHADNSALVLRQNSGRTGTAPELNKIEQQSLHVGQSSGSRQATRVKPAPLPKTSAARGDRNQPINFTGHSAGGNHAATNRKSHGGPPRGAGTRPH